MYGTCMSPLPSRAARTFSPAHRPDLLKFDTFFQSTPVDDPPRCAPCSLRSPSPHPLSSLARSSPQIKGDGRCLFRAIAQGLARSKGVSLLGPEETEEADLLRMAVHNALCAEKPRKEYHPAIRSAHVDAPMPTYCARLQSPTFWGGDPELLCLAQMLKTPIFVYLSEKEQGTGTGFVPIMKYG